MKNTLVTVTMLSIITVALNGCGKDEQPLEQTEQTLSPVQQEIALAIEQQDHRLLMTTGRRPTLPGLEKLAFDEVKKLCGVKPLANAGDVLRTQEQKEQRKQQLEFARQFNVAVYEHCRKNNADR